MRQLLQILRSFPSHFGTGLTLGLTAAVVVGCSLEPKSSGTKLYLTVPGEIPSLTQAILPSLDRVNPPGTLNGFACLAVNVVGPGIPDSGPHPKPHLAPIFDRVLRRESYCSYRGVMAGPVFPQSGSYGPTELSVTVPAGALRLVQIVGVAESAGCLPGQLAREPGGTTGRYYEVGRAVLDGVFGDRSVAVPNEWTTASDQSARALDCAGGPGGCNLIQQNLEENADYTTDTGSAYRLAQQFEFPVPTLLSAITIKGYAQTSGPAKMDIYAETLTPFPQPTGAVLASATAPTMPMGGTAAEVRFEFNGGAGVNLSSGKYWMVLEKATGGSDFITWTGTVNAMPGRDAPVKGQNAHVYAQFTSPTIKAFYHRIESCPGGMPAVSEE